ncbi:hypothetical protein, partial [Gracilimonas sp.]|uniref:hypothetical protein n=1 Tax=Gracilimonas sp. TaxID=1974203 RepID=UPI0032EB0DAE
EQSIVISAFDGKHWSDDLVVPINSSGSAQSPPDSLSSVAQKAIDDVYKANKVKLGQPISEPADLGNGFLKQSFESGYITWNGQKAVPYLIGTGKASPSINFPSTVKPLWDAVAPNNNGKNKLIFYDRDSGDHEFYRVNDNGSMHLIRKDSGWRKTWDMIIPGDFNGDGKTNLLFYDRHTGDYEFYRVNDNGSMHLIRKDSGWRKTWDMIIPDAAEVKRNTEDPPEDSYQPDPNYTYKEADYLNTLYQDNVGNTISSEYDWYHKNRYATDSIDGHGVDG